MTGPEHYRAAEDILDNIFTWPDDGPDVTDAITMAHVHATLALAAATALAADPAPEALDAWVPMLMDDDG